VQGFNFPTSSFFAKGFEFIADLNNWGQLKPSQGEFVNHFVMLRPMKNRSQRRKKVTAFQFVRHPGPGAKE
jgi:hypothetical protein